MSTAQDSIFSRTFDPIYQALICFGAVVLVILGGKLVNLIGIMDVSNRFPWLTSASFILFFAMFNSVFSLSAKNMAKYWGRSIYSFMGLAAISGLTAYLFSSISISDAGSYRWIYFVLTLGYLVFLSMMTFMRKIVEFAQREEWNHPRIRQKNRKK
jgi:hypothetical protein